MESEDNIIFYVALIVAILLFTNILISGSEHIARFDCNGDGQYETVYEEYNKPDRPMAVSIEAHKEFLLNICKKEFDGNGYIANVQEINYKVKKVRN